MRKQTLNMAGSKTRVIALAAVVALCSAALAACGGGGSTATTGASGASGAAGTGQVSASDYVASVCGAIVDLRSTVKSDQASAQQALTTGGNDPAAVKEQLSKFISEVASATQQLAAEVKNAGTPDVPNGDQFASRLNNRLDQITTAVQGAENKVNALPTSSPQAFSSAAQSFDANFTQQISQFSQLDPSSGSPELKQAADQNSDCQSLQGG
jgi:hypothetical protein